MPGVVMLQAPDRRMSVKRLRQVVVKAALAKEGITAAKATRKALQDAMLAKVRAPENAVHLKRAELWFSCCCACQAGGDTRVLWVQVSSSSMFAVEDGFVRLL